MLDHFGTINVSIETIYNDLLQAIPYDSALIITNNEFNLFPNPNNGNFTIELYNNLNYVAIYDLKGQLIFSQKLPKGTHSINLDNSGFYYLKINEYQYSPLMIE